jgi:putative transposase
MPLKRRRTPSKYIYYALQLYISGLSLRKTSQRLSQFVKRNHISIWNWIQWYQPKKILQIKRKVSEFIIDETLLKVGENYVWIILNAVWIAIEPIDKIVLGIRISIERSILVAEQVIQKLAIEYGKHPVYTDGCTWYPQACKFLKLEHHLHSSFEKSIIERTIQYVKDRTECFDDYFPCRKNKCTLEHVMRWLNLFVGMHNEMILKRLVK